MPCFSSLVLNFPWLHGHGRTAAPATHRRQGNGPVRGTGPRPDAAPSRGQPGADDRRPEAAGDGPILRLQPVARVGLAGRLDAATPALRRAVQWKIRGKRYQGLRRHKVPERSASAAIFSPKGPWRLSPSGALHRPSPMPASKSLGLPSHGETRGRLIRRTAVVRTRMPGGVGGVASQCHPIPIDRHEHDGTLRRNGTEGRPWTPTTFWPLGSG